MSTILDHNVPPNGSCHTNVLWSCLYPMYLEKRSTLNWLLWVIELNSHIQFLQGIAWYSISSAMICRALKAMTNNFNWICNYFNDFNTYVILMGCSTSYLVTICCTVPGATSWSPQKAVPCIAHCSSPAEWWSGYDVRTSEPR